MSKCVLVNPLLHPLFWQLQVGDLSPSLLKIIIIVLQRKFILFTFLYSYPLPLPCNSIMCLLLTSGLVAALSLNTLATSNVIANC